MLSSVFIFFFVFELPFYLSLFLLPERGDNLSLKGLEMCLIEGIMVLEATDGMVSLERGDLISSESLCLGVLGCGDLETDGLGPLYLMVGDYFLLFLLLLFFFLDLLFFRSGSMSENLLSLSDYLLPLVIRTIVLPGFEICEEMASSCSLSSIDASWFLLSSLASFTKMTSLNSFLKGTSLDKRSAL